MWKLLFRDGQKLENQEKPSKHKREPANNPTDIPHWGALRGSNPRGGTDQLYHRCAVSWVPTLYLNEWDYENHLYLVRAHDWSFLAWEAWRVAGFWGILLKDILLVHEINSWRPQHVGLWPNMENEIRKNMAVVGGTLVLKVMRLGITGAGVTSSTTLAQMHIQVYSPECLKKSRAIKSRTLHHRAVQTRGAVFSHFKHWCSIYCYLKLVPKLAKNIVLYVSELRR